MDCDKELDLQVKEALTLRREQKANTIRITSVARPADYKAVYDGGERGKVKHFRVNFSSKRFHFTLPNFRQKKTGNTRFLLILPVPTKGK